MNALAPSQAFKSFSCYNMLSSTPVVVPRHWRNISFAPVGRVICMKNEEFKGFPSILQGTIEGVSRSSTMTPICKDEWECDWESLTNEEFKGFLSTLQGTTEGVPRSRFATIEEYIAFRKRHGRYLVLVSEELSDLFKGVDLITLSKDRKGYDDELSDADDVPFNFPTYVKAEADKVNKSKRST